MAGLRMTQEEWVGDYIKTYGKIDQNTANGWGITRLAARINELRKRGMVIDTEMTTVNSRWNNGKASVATYIYKGVLQ